MNLVGGTFRAIRLLTFLGLAIGLPVLIPLESRADTIHLRNGNIVKGKVVHQDEDFVTIEVPAHEDPAQAKGRPPIRNKILRLYIERVVIGESTPVSPRWRTFEPTPERGLGFLFRTLPLGFLARWDQVTEDSTLPGVFFLGTVCIVTLILIPALFLLAGSSIVGVPDPTYSRALLCIALLVGYTLAFAWGANRVGWLDTLVIYKETPGHLALLLPLYFIGQGATYKWCYVTSWGKAVGLVLMGLLVGVITLTGFYVLLTIFAS